MICIRRTDCNGSLSNKVLAQVAAAVMTAQAEGRTVSAESAGVDGDGADEAEEWTSDQLSNAAAVASSVLAQHGAVQQVTAHYWQRSFSQSLESRAMSISEQHVLK